MNNSLIIHKYQIIHVRWYHNTSKLSNHSTLYFQLHYWYKDRGEVHITSYSLVNGWRYGINCWILQYPLVLVSEDLDMVFSFLFPYLLSVFLVKCWNKDVISWLKIWGIDENVILQSINEENLKDKRKLRYYKGAIYPHLED